jgi:hypothetical protein
LFRPSLLRTASRSGLRLSKTDSVSEHTNDNTSTMLTMKKNKMSILNSFALKLKR